MGHYSNFKIDIISEISEELKNKFYESLEEVFYFYNNENEMKWYRYREDLKKVSEMEEFKEIVFVVTRRGEMDDYNLHLFSNGEIHNLIPPQFNSETTNNFEEYFN